MVILLPGQTVNVPMDYGLQGREGVVGLAWTDDRRTFCRHHMAEQKVMAPGRDRGCPYCYATFHTDHWCGKCELCDLFALVYAGKAPWMTEEGRAAYFAAIRPGQDDEQPFAVEANKGET